MMGHYVFCLQCLWTTKSLVVLFLIVTKDSMNFSYELNGTCNYRTLYLHKLHLNYIRYLMLQTLLQGSFRGKSN